MFGSHGGGMKAAALFARVLTCVGCQGEQILENAVATTPALSSAGPTPSTPRDALGELPRAERVEPIEQLAVELLVLATELVHPPLALDDLLA